MISRRIAELFYFYRRPCLHLYPRNTNLMLSLPFIHPQLIGSPNVCYASEQSTVDPAKKLMTLKTINLTFGSFLSVYETLSYVPHPSDPGKTLLKQEATVQVEGVPLNRYMEDVLTKNISTNAGKGRQGLEWVIGKLNSEVRMVVMYIT